MKESLFLKKYFNVINKKSVEVLDIDDRIEVQFSFSTVRDVRVVRDLVIQINNSFNKNIILFSFLSSSAATAFLNEGSSFNFFINTRSKLAFFLFLNLLFKLNINFSIISFVSNLDLFSINFFKAFTNNKLICDSSKFLLINNFSRSFLFFLKKIEFFNSVRFLKLLNSFKKS